MLPCFSIGFAEGAQQLTDADRRPYAAVGLLAGAAWQVLYRRDLATRLTLPVVGACFIIASVLISGDEFMTGDDALGLPSVLLYCVGVLCGLVLTEHHLRWQDRRAEAEELSLPAAPGPSRGSAPR